MTHLRRVAVLDADALAAARRLRDGVVLEAAAGADRFVAVAGPLERYERVLHIEPRPDGTADVTEEVSYRLGLPGWGRLAAIPLRRSLRPGAPGRGLPWWAPPQRVDRAQAAALSRLTLVAVASGYVGTLLSQLTTFAGDEFGAGAGAQGSAQAATRLGIVVALVATAAADRLGRRRTLLVSLLGACAASALTAAAPSLLLYAAIQVIARGFATGADVIRAVILTETMPAGARAYGISLTAMCAGLGSGMAVWMLPLADTGPSAWRVLFGCSLLFVPLVLWAGRGLAESERFEAHRADRLTPTLSHHRGRLTLLATSALLTTVFAAPASQLQNEYLRTERGYTGVAITAFTLLTATPAGLAVFFGGRLSDVHGRRRIGALGLVGGTLGVTTSYLLGGAGLWVGAMVGTLFAGLVVPALVVYGPELFPTALRGRASGLITLFGVMGSVTGLLTVGWLADAWDRFGPAFAVVATGPMLVAVLVLARYPETARRELEDLNPSDRVHRRVPAPR